MRLDHLIIVRAPHLLNLDHSPQELADELGVAVRTVRAWAQQGMPHTRDATQHLWINGRAFAQWVTQVRSVRPHVRMGPGEAFCLRCKRPVPLEHPRPVLLGGRAGLQSVCPTCGATVNRSL